MTCITCNNDLRECTCPDLRERFERLLKSEYLVFGEDYQKQIRDQIKKNETEKELKE